jgi:hypothetical protein
MSNDTPTPQALGELVASMADARREMAAEAGVTLSEDDLVASIKASLMERAGQR